MCEIADDFFVTPFRSGYSLLNNLESVELHPLEHCS